MRKQLFRNYLWTVGTTTQLKCFVWKLRLVCSFFSFTVLYSLRHGLFLRSRIVLTLSTIFLAISFSPSKSCFLYVVFGLYTLPENQRNAYVVSAVWAKALNHLQTNYVGAKMISINQVTINFLTHENAESLGGGASLLVGWLDQTWVTLEIIAYREATRDQISIKLKIIMSSGGNPTCDYPLESERVLLP